jgi:hypothetical protein
MVGPFEPARVARPSPHSSIGTSSSALRPGDELGNRFVQVRAPLRGLAHDLRLSGHHLGQRAVVRLHLGGAVHEVAEAAPGIWIVERGPCVLGEAVEVVGGERLEKGVLGGVVAIDGADADTGLAGDVVDLGLEPVAREAPAGRFEHPPAVAPRVRPQGPAGSSCRWRFLDAGSRADL